MNNFDKKLNRPLISTVLEKNYVIKKKILEISDQDKKNVEEMVKLHIGIYSDDMAALKNGSDDNLDEAEVESKIRTN